MDDERVAGDAAQTGLGESIKHFNNQMVRRRAIMQDQKPSAGYNRP